MSVQNPNGGVAAAVRLLSPVLVCACSTIPGRWLGPVDAGRMCKHGEARMGRQWLGTLLFLVGTTAGAADLKISITDQRGKPVGDAVVTVLPTNSPTAGSAAAQPEVRTKTINQVALTFVPYIEVFRPGDKVVFRNSDKTRHHVYSFSPVKAFEFMLSPGQSSAPLELEKSGVVAVGCNIHDSMITYLYVSDAPWITRSSADGKATISGLPAGSYTVRVWQPRLRPGRPDLAQSAALVTGSESKAVTFALNLLPDSRRQFDREHTRY
jgi:plastocyanin